MPGNLTPEQEKALMKEAIDEWLDKQAARFGRLSLRIIVVGIALLGFYSWLKFNGWNK